MGGSKQILFSSNRGGAYDDLYLLDLVSSHTAFSILSLSNQYAVSTSETQRTLLLPAATALLALNRFSSPGAFPGSGGYVSMFLIAIAGLIFSATLLKNPQFGRWTAFTGLIANSLDLMYCLAFPFSPNAVHEKLVIFFIPAAGFFLVAWHILVGMRLLHIARMSSKIRTIRTALPARE